MQSDGTGISVLRRLKNAAFPSIDSSFSKLLATYRLCSVIMTGLIYLLSPSPMMMAYKLIVVVTLTISAVITNALVNSHAGDTRYISAATAIETLGIALLLIPTGGMDSPYLWYALNPVLVTACYLKPVYYWLLFGFYCLTSAAISAVLYRGDYPGLTVALERWRLLFLIFVLSMLAMQLLAQMIRKKMKDAAALKQQKEELDAANVKLTDLNAKLEESVNDLMSLYQSIDDLAMETDRNVVVASLTHYAVTLSKSPFSFFLVNEPEEKDTRAAFSGDSPVREEIGRMAGELIDGNACNEEPVTVTVGGCEFLVLAVKSMTRLYGVLGISAAGYDTRKASRIDCTRLSFIASLFAIVLDRVGVNEVENRLMIAQERNRIADEIHDSICQRLFSISCSAHSLAGGFGSMDSRQVQEQLDLIEECSKAANQEIRLCVYGLSSKKRKVNTLFEELEKYLWSFAKLNGIVLDIDLVGDDNLLSVNLQNSLHRIVRESCGNAARHGKCKNIAVKLTVEDKAVFLRIADDGTGFTVEEDRSGTSSVGIKNMTTIVEQYGGAIIIESQLQKGTTITVRIPLAHEDSAEDMEAIL